MSTFDHEKSGQLGIGVSFAAGLAIGAGATGIPTAALFLSGQRETALITMIAAFVTSAAALTGAVSATRARDFHNRANIASEVSKAGPR